MQANGVTGATVAPMQPEEPLERTDPGMSELARCRAAIDRLDEMLIMVLAERCAVASASAGLKRAAGQPMVDPAREAAVVRRAAELARSAGLEPEAVRRLYWHVVALCRGSQLEPVR
ncbi:MAG TPA: chorismate mutase [Longimicrobiales bacterium]|nr:chorismate mutase [Longimicrobiales bacterium]